MSHTKSPRRCSPFLEIQTAPGKAVERNMNCQSCKDLHRFVNEIIRYGEEPSSWPLTQQEQIAFVRTVIYQARKIRNTEEYLAEEIKIAAENLAMASCDL